jgi:hypothetical protein
MAIIEPIQPAAGSSAANFSVNSLRGKPSRTSGTGKLPQFSFPTLIICLLRLSVHCMGRRIVPSFMPVD